MFIIPALKSLRQKIHMLEVHFACIQNSIPAWAGSETLSKKENQKISKEKGRIEKSEVGAGDEVEFLARLCKVLSSIPRTMGRKEGGGLVI